MRLRTKPQEEQVSTTAADFSVVLGPVEEPGALRRAGRSVAAVLSRRFLLPSIAAVLAVVLAVLGWLTYRDARSDDASAEALTEASAAVEKLLSYTPVTVESGLKDRLELTTGDFRDEYGLKVKDTTAPTAIEQNLSAKATVVARGVVEEGSDSVDLLLFVNVSYSTPQATEPVVQGSRVAVTAEKVDGDWKVSALNPL